MEYQTITRAEAKEQGLKYYFTGKPCKHGHVALKYIRNNTCIICAKNYTTRSVQKNKDHYLAYKRDYYRNADKSIYKNYALKSKFDITLEEYNIMLSNQGGVCKICNEPETAKGRSLAVDHCHKTGKIRGLLCMSCNIALGKLKDDLEIIRNLLTYLQDNVSD